MPFIRTRRVKYGDNGEIVSGTAAIIDVTYIKGGNGSNHSKQVVREKLGKIIELKDKRHGLFQHPERGLVRYDADKDEFTTELTRDEAVTESPKVQEKLFPDHTVHTVFGDTYFLFEIIKRSGLMKVIAEAFPDKVFRERLLCHIAHEILRDGSKIRCDDFISKSFASYCVPDVTLSSLNCDTSFFSRMGRDQSRLAFFKRYTDFMRGRDKDFGKAGFIDSTPLPNDINSPFNALCSHGLSETSIQMRLALILDQNTQMPIWYSVFSGNVLDFSTLEPLTRDVEVSLGIHIDTLYLDAGYASKALVQSFELQPEGAPIPEKKYLVRMPAKKGYPHKELYAEAKPLISSAAHDFVRNDHSYFGMVKLVEIFGRKVCAYIYVDHFNALKGYSDFLQKRPEEFEKLTAEEKDWQKVKYGFFVLISNYRSEPSKILDEYFSRVEIETAFKTDKEYLDLLPLRKWKDDTIRGKLLTDIISSIVRCELMRSLNGAPYSMSCVIGKTQSLMCLYDESKSTVFVEPANKQVREYYKTMNLEIPKSIDLKDYANHLLAGA